MDDDKKNEDITPEVDNQEEEYTPPEAMGPEDEETDVTESATQESPQVEEVEVMPEPETEVEPVADVAEAAPENVEPSEEVFVDEPAAQPPLPADFEKALNDQKPSTKKSKKMLLIVLALLVIAGGAAAYYFMGQKKDEPQDQANNSQAEQAQTIEAMVYQSDTSLSAYSPSEDITTSPGIMVPDEAKILKVSEDGKTALYATTEKAVDSDVNGVLVITKATAEGEEQVFKSTSIATASPYVNAVVSSDLNNVAFAAAPTANEGVKVVTAPLDGSNAETAIVDSSNNNDLSGLLEPVLWAPDNSSVFLQEVIACDNCEVKNTGLYRAAVSEKKLEIVFTQPTGTNNTRTVPSPDGKQIVVTAAGFIERDSDQTEIAFDVYSVDTTSLASTKVYSKQKDTDVQQSVDGWSSDSKNLFISVSTEETAEGETIPKTTFARFDVVTPTGVDPAGVPIVMDSLNDGSQVVTQAFGFSSTLFFVTMSNSDTSGESATYDLYSLPIGGGETAIKTVTTNQTILNLLGTANIQQ